MKSRELREKILSKPMPKNIAIILDGNGRWAKKRGLPRIVGHAKGIKTLVEISEETQDLGLDSLLVYAFSTENWSRPTDEVKFLMNALIENLVKYKKRIIKRQTKVVILGERNNLSEDVLNAINEIERDTAMFDSFTLGICFNYGGHQEIINATKELAEEVLSGNLKIEDINKEIFEKHLYTKDFGPLDLLIRTSGEERLSNFLPWQSAYSEFVFTKTYWPDFHAKELYMAIDEYQSRSRRFGGLEKKGHE